jgi:hypothetical protein
MAEKAKGAARGRDQQEESEIDAITRWTDGTGTRCVPFHAHYSHSHLGLLQRDCATERICVWLEQKQIQNFRRESLFCVSDADTEALAISGVFHRTRILLTQEFRRNFTGISLILQENVGIGIFFPQSNRPSVLTFAVDNWCLDKYAIF